MGLRNIFHKQTYSILSHSHTIVMFSIQRLKKGKILTDGTSVLFQLHHVGPRNIFHKPTYKALSPSHTTVLYSIQRIEKDKILTDGISIPFLLHHGTQELPSSINKLTGYCHGHILQYCTVYRNLKRQDSD